jgi:radical SAM superfamily enzyme YgiQ (UPF0313 family)
MSKGKVIFVEPLGAPSNVFAKFMNIPLLGPLYLATMAKKDGYNTTVINENILHRKVNDSELKDADILCLSCITATINRGKEIARQYRHLRSKAGLKSRILIGGIHVSMLPKESCPDFDQIICGEGESVFLDILNGKITTPTIKGSALENLDSLPSPDFSLLQKSSVINIQPVMTSRGCPHHCNFCSVTQMFGRGYRYQSVERVLDEIATVKKNWIFFVDDNFAVVKDRTYKLLDEMIRLRFFKNWTAQVRVDAARDELMVKKMRKAGCKIVFIGFESINPKSLNEMHKRQSLEDIKWAIRTFQSAGIQVHGMFMLGNDPDTNEIFKATSQFSRQNNLNYVQYSILTPLPGTEVYHNFEHQGRLLHKNWAMYDGLHVVFQPKNMSPVELQNGMINCFRAFYSYSNAFKDTTLTFFKGLKETSERFSHGSLQSYYPAFMKFAGRSIIQNWLRNNQAYLAYLQNLCH